MKTLSCKQEEILKFLIDFNSEHGFPPTVRELCDFFGFKSLNTGHFHLRSLEKKGYIQIHSGKGRGITLTRAFRLPERGIPVVGRIAAGTPILAVENIEEYLDMSLFRAEDCFAVQVRGDSMIDAHIQDGDYVIIKIQEQAQNGDIVAALIDDEVTLKYFYRNNNEVRLEAANSKYPPLIFREGDPRNFRILGVMVGLVRKR
ncbi:MAG: transcriptional repressor LexA [Deltaproteobacteria bacterium]|nr:transcriptional repressor LexA [Deltaproteobacteria bacterium]